MWPTPQDYNEAVQNPRLCFRDADMREASVVLNSLGLPKPVTGAFASVYQMDDERGRQFAVRCFLHNVPDQAMRYAAISAELKQLALPCMVPFDFVSDGIQINSVAYPILKMQWINGSSLIDWLARRLDYPDQLAALTQKFKSMCDDLRTSGIAHGDLQHGNIIIADDEIKLVDYDAMYVPSLAGKESPEIGHRHYQHPHRTAQHFDAELDTFSAASIYTSLLCLSIDPTLWRSLGAGDECLLFRDEDYAAPLDSVAFRLLENHESLEIQRGARDFRALCVGSRTSAQAAASDRVLPAMQPLPPRLSSGGRNVRDAARVELLVNDDPAKPRLRVVEEEATRKVPAETQKKVPVQVLPRKIESKNSDKLGTWAFILMGLFPIFVFAYFIVTTPALAPRIQTFQKAALPPESVTVATHRIALAQLNAADWRGFQTYTDYMKLIQRQLSEAEPQRIAFTELNKVALFQESQGNFDFALRIRGLEFELVKTVRGPQSMTPRMQSDALILILRNAAANRTQAGDGVGATIFNRAANDAETTRKTSPLTPIQWPEEFAMPFVQQ